MIWVDVRTDRPRSRYAVFAIIGTTTSPPGPVGGRRDGDEVEALFAALLTKLAQDVVVDQGQTLVRHASSPLLPSRLVSVNFAEIES